MTLIETAKLHQVDSEKYIVFLLEHLPNEETLEKKGECTISCVNAKKE
ncbi:transposase domain-containing protein [Streptococcus danieliae]|uniref:Transposase domain-containing protein n=2 Tax=Streptococcus danieliae TaxID=747656 RepID=A0A7Z0LED5_9STRE|nr:transposase domain-containing protein [Streptococcus danieliae]MBF0718030.1 transposase domain-containing protein [Streptococcus danieliae]NYS49960.1 transposase domain-containing protein [Streptococcus danieliae]